MFNKLTERKVSRKKGRKKGRQKKKKAKEKKARRKKKERQKVDWLIGFYGISTIVDYLMPNPLYTYISNI